MPFVSSEVPQPASACRLLPRNSGSSMRGPTLMWQVLLGHHFDVAWRRIRSLANEPLLSSRLTAKVAAHRRGLLFDGCIATGRILSSLDYGPQWLDGLARAGRSYPVVGRGRQLYRDFEALRSYQLQSARRTEGRIRVNDARGSNFLETTTQTVSWFNKRLKEDELILKPLFQRNPVWTNAQKSYLIDSILRGYPVPEIYLQTVEDPQGNERHLVVDGQQRIRACLEFTAGGFPLTEDSTDWDGDLFEDLSSDRKKQIRQYKFSVRVLPELSDALLREIFGRLNRNNMALNRQELRNATYWGEFIATMKQLADSTFWVRVASSLLMTSDVCSMSNS